MSAFTRTPVLAVIDWVISLRSNLTLLWVAALGLWIATYLPQATVGVQAEKAANLSPGYVGFMFALYGGALVLSRIPIGILGTFVREKKLLMGGLLATSVGLALVPLVPYPAALLGSRVFLGIGSGFWVIYTTLYVRLSSRSTGEAMARITLAYGVGIAIAGILGGILVEQWGWFAPFWAGAVISMLAIFALLPLKEGREERTSSSFQRGRFLSLLCNPRLLLISMIALLAFFVGFSTVWGFSQNFAARTLDATPLWLGIIAFAALFAYASAMRSSVFIRGRVGSRTAVVVGLGLVSAGTLSIPFSGGVRVLAALHAVIGLGLGTVYPILMAASIENTDANARTEAMGVFQSIYALGILFGPLVSGLIVQTVGMKPMFLVNACVAFLAVLLSVVLFPKLRTFAE